MASKPHVIYMDEANAYALFILRFNFDALRPGCVHPITPAEQELLNEIARAVYSDDQESLELFTPLLRKEQEDSAKFYSADPDAFNKWLAEEKIAAMREEDSHWSYDSIEGWLYDGRPTVTKLTRPKVKK